MPDARDQMTGSLFIGSTADARRAEDAVRSALMEVLFDFRCERRPDPPAHADVLFPVFANAASTLGERAAVERIRSKWGIGHDEAA